MKLVSGSCKSSSFLYPWTNYKSLCRGFNWVQSPMQILTGFCHVASPDGLIATLLSQGCVLEQLPAWARQAECTLQSLGRKCGNSNRSSLWIKLAVTSSWWPSPAIKTAILWHLSSLLKIESWYFTWKKCWNLTLVIFGNNDWHWVWSMERIE